MTAVPDIDPRGTNQEELGNKLAEYSLMLRELYASSQRYKAIVDSSDDAIISKDLHGVITSWNKGAQRVFGYSEAEAVGRPVKMLIPPELHYEEDNILKRLRQGQRIDHYVTQRVAKDGRRVDISLTISPIRDEHGEIIGASKVARDIGAQLRESALQNRLSAIVESSDDAIISKDLDGIITSWNKAAERIFGYPAEEILGRSVLQLIPAELHEEERQILARLRKGQRIEHFETVRLRKDGQRVHLSITVSPIRDERNDIIGASNVSRDISLQKQAMQRILESEEKFTSIFRSSPVGMVLVQPRTLTITDANPAFLDLMQMSAKDLKGGPIWDDHPIDDIARWTELTHELERNKKLVDKELTLHIGHGSKELLINATYLNIHGAESVLFHVEDISERKAAYVALQETDRRKDEFIATLSHELRNPLAPLSNALQMLDVAKDPETWKDAKEIMERQLSHMVRLLNDLMDMSRVSRGAISLQKEDLHLSTALVQAVETAMPLIGSAGHELLTYHDPHPIVVHADPTRLVQIFSNLLNNAAKYTPPGGTITLSYSLEGTFARISVSDTGIGIEPAKLSKVFEMFTQMEPATSMQHGGLGIGLSVAKRLVEMHGGRIDAYSEGKGKGSTFTVYLPIAGGNPASGG
jgi:PAS domain S-box-containing protein